MGTVVKRVNPSGDVVYRAQIRVKKSGFPDFSESRTFSKRSLAVEWLRRREGEIERDPDILFGDGGKVVYPTLKEAVERYLSEARDFGRSKQMGLLFLAAFPIGKIRIDRLRRDHFSDHVLLRRDGAADLEIAPIAASTALQELQYIRSVLKHANFAWGMDVSWSELDIATEGLRRSRLISRSRRRDRLPSGDELQALTSFFYERWNEPLHRNMVPMHLIMWFAIYSCRRQDEIGRLLLADFNRADEEWLVRDLKHPGGSFGNNKKFHVPKLLLPVIDELLLPDVQRRVGEIARMDGALVPVMGKTIGSAFARGCKVLGIDDLRFHDLRHEGATRLAEDGLTVPQIQSVTLHDSWGSLQRYVNLRKRGARLDFNEAVRVARGA